MPKYTDAKWHSNIQGEQTGILVKIEGVETYVPREAVNPDYQALMEAVEKGDITISA